jgi:hypothetical protein
MITPEVAAEGGTGSAGRTERLLRPPLRAFCCIAANRRWGPIPVSRTAAKTLRRHLLGRSVGFSSLSIRPVQTLIWLIDPNQRGCGTNPPIIGLLR